MLAGNPPSSSPIGPSHPHVSVGAGQHLAEAVDHGRGRRRELVQHGSYGRAHLPVRGGAAQAVEARVGPLDQPVQMHTLAGRHPQGIGERRHHRGGRVPVAPLFQPDQVLDADAGEDGQFGAAQPRRAAARAGRQPDGGRGDGLSRVRRNRPNSLSLMAGRRRSRPGALRRMSATYRTSLVVRVRGRFRGVLLGFARHAPPSLDASSAEAGEGVPATTTLAAGSLTGAAIGRVVASDTTNRIRRSHE